MVPFTNTDASQSIISPARSLTFIHVLCQCGFYSVRYLEDTDHESNHDYVERPHEAPTLPTQHKDEWEGHGHQHTACQHIHTLVAVP